MSTETPKHPRKEEPDLRSSVTPGIRLVTIKQLCAAAGESRTSIWRKVKSGDLPKPFLFGGKVVWRESTLEKHFNKLEKAV